MRIKNLLILLAAFSATTETWAMPAETVRLVAWRNGETIQGDEFIPANELIVDYLATLRHPSTLLEGIRYNCTAKTRVVQPSVQTPSAPNVQGYAEFVMVYELKDCTEDGHVTR